MTVDWQTVVAIMVVSLAALTLLRRGWRWARGSGANGCGTCPNKNSPSVVKTLPLVQIQPPKRSSVQRFLR